MLKLYKQFLEELFVYIRLRWFTAQRLREARENERRVENVMGRLDESWFRPEAFLNHYKSTWRLEMTDK